MFSPLPDFSSIQILQSDFLSTTSFHPCTGLFYNQPVGYKGGLSVSTLQMTKTLSDANEAWAIAVGKFSGSQGGVTLAASSPKFDIYTGKVSIDSNGNMGRK